MRHHILFQIISFKSIFNVSLGNNFFTVLWRPPALVVEALCNCPVCPPIKSGPVLCVVVATTPEVSGTGFGYI